MGEARCPAPSVQEIIRGDAIKAPPVLTHEHYEYMGSEDIDYSRYPLCIHRAPVNVNTASDKVLTALFMGLDIQHGHPVAVGTDADLKATQRDWKYTDANGTPFDPHDQLAYVLKPRGVKRIPASSGKLILDRPKPWSTADESNFGYIANYGAMGE